MMKKIESNELLQCNGLFRTDKIMSMHLQSIVTKRCCCNDSWIIDAEKERKLFIVSDSQPKRGSYMRADVISKIIMSEKLHFYIL